jgi:inner membrane protein
MPSVFGHFAAAAALGAAFFPGQMRPAVLLVAGACACAPDLDVLAFRFGIPYGSVWGHRGWTHSLVFAGLLGGLAAGLGFHRAPDFPKILAWCVLATASHPLLDMLTNGGRGVALWWPFQNDRIFFPFRPIQVSPLGAGAFFSEWGVRVLVSEAIWIGGPALLMILLAKAWRQLQS